MLTEKDIGKMLSAQLFSILHDSTYSYVSTSSPDFSHLTPDGENLMMEVIRMVVPKAVALEQKKMQDYAEQVVMKNLSK